MFIPIPQSSLGHRDSSYSAISSTVMDNVHPAMILGNAMFLYILIVCIHTIDFDLGTFRRITIKKDCGPRSNTALHKSDSVFCILLSSPRAKLCKCIGRYGNVLATVLQLTM